VIPVKDLEGEGLGGGAEVVHNYLTVGLDSDIERLKKSCLDLLLTSYKMEPHLLLLLNLCVSAKSVSS
jgi:hypothetical protein